VQVDDLAAEVQAQAQTILDLEDLLFGGPSGGAGSS
jgi:hypothetical protein